MSQGAIPQMSSVEGENRIHTLNAVLNAWVAQSRTYLEDTIPRDTELPDYLTPKHQENYWKKHIQDGLSALCAYRPGSDVFTAAFAVAGRTPQPKQEADEEERWKTVTGPQKTTKRDGRPVPLHGADNLFLLSSNRGILDPINLEVHQEIPILLDRLNAIAQEAKNATPRPQNPSFVEKITNRITHKGLWDAEQSFISSVYEFCYPKLFHRVRKGGYFKDLITSLRSDAQVLASVEVNLEYLTEVLDLMSQLYDYGSKAEDETAASLKPIGRERRKQLNVLEAHRAAHKLAKRLQNNKGLRDLLNNYRYAENHPNSLRLVQKVSALFRTVNNLVCATAYLSLTESLPAALFNPTWVCRETQKSKVTANLGAGAAERLNTYYQELIIHDKPPMSPKDWRAVVHGVKTHAQKSDPFGWTLKEDRRKSGVFSTWTGVHCEVKILMFKLKNALSLDPSYIGGSKLCCVSCFLFIESYNEALGTQHGQITVPGCHHNCYTAWCAPSAVKATALSPELNQIYPKMVHKLLLAIVRSYKLALFEQNEHERPHRRTASESTAESVQRTFPDHSGAVPAG
ncbi:hypothetical protein K466DRAFT_569444 [Polyporus arcularius HHB13444]|uniref:Uncharacterized protein n=1 Tax=Polyporus arcularius HHB13444 TaxID=1314778 RepID=A0A5C3NUS5_9APHY|nr:hypothetical protein K466DRAFT_569444 [Polyporus arcularius HHB13444]